MLFSRSELVEPDLNRIVDWLSSVSPKRALHFIDEMEAEFQRIQRQPLIYRLRPEFGDGARLAPVGKYVILYFTDATAVRIERVLHGSSDLSRLQQ